MNQKESNFGKWYPRWTIFHSLVCIAGLVIALKYSFEEYWLFTIGMSMSWFVYSFCIPTYANAVTIGRLISILILTFFYSDLSSNILLLGFTIAISLDGVDGFLARKLRQTTQSGGALDMETDSILVMLLTWIHYTEGKIEWYFLIPATLRYSYELGFFWLRKYDTDLPTKRVRATIAVVYFISLLLPFLDMSGIDHFVLSLASILIIFSFGISIVSRLHSLLKKKDLNFFN